MRRPAATRHLIGRRRSIGTKLTGASLIAALVPLSIVGLLTYNQVRNSLGNDARERLDAIATVQKARVESYLFFSEINLELVSSRTQLGQWLAAYLAGPNDEDVSRMNITLADARDSASGVVRSIHIVDLEGTILASTEAAQIGESVADRAFFAEASSGNTLGFVSTTSDGTLVGDHAGPIPQSGDPLGIVLIEAELGPLRASLGDLTGLGASEESYLVRPEAEGFQLITPLRDQNETEVGQAAPHSAMAIALGPEAGSVVDTIDYRGSDVFAATRGIAGTDWGLVVKVDRSDALASVSAFRTLLLVSIVLAGLAAVALAHVLTARVTAPIRRLTTLAGEMSSDGHETRVLLDSDDEIGALARALNRMADRHESSIRDLQSKSDQLQQFLYVASHDLKTPLRAISSYGQLLAADHRRDLDEPGQDFLDRINENATRMYSLIDDLLAYVKAGQIEGSFEAVNLDGVLDRVRATQELDLREASATLSISKLGTCFGSPVLLEEVFANLVGNAIKYRRADVPARIGVSATNGSDDQITVRVEDNGIGIPAEHRERIFEPFHRLHRNDEIAGTGVGLAICERVVSGHGGTIRATASNLGGTVVLVTLPRFSSTVR